MHDVIEKIDLAVRMDAPHVAKRIGDEAITPLYRRAAAVERVEFAVAGDRLEWIGERCVTGELGEVIPRAVIVEGGPLLLW